MKVTAKVTLNQSVLKELEKAQKLALEQTGEAIKSDLVTSAVIPKNIGDLERSGYVDTSELDRGKVSVVYDTPYARRLYWHPEYNFRTDKNPNAQGKWMESYHAGEKKKFVTNAFKTLLKQYAKGLIK